LASLKATKNISEYPVAPSVMARRVFRPKPVIRESRMPKLFENMDFNLMVGLHFGILRG
jgi:hypothetical protein